MTLSKFPLPYQKEAVGQFIDTFEVSTSPALWAKLLKEEAEELLDALSKEEDLKEACDLVYVSAGFSLACERSNDHAPLVTTSLLCVLEPALSKVSEIIEDIGSTVFREAFMRVHASNMSKVGDDGKPIKLTNGKVAKGPNYKPPVLTDLLN